MSGVTRLVLAATVAAAIAPGIAQGKTLGSHSMAATVTNVDSQTGMMDVDAGGHALKLHFPPSALGDVKNGDKITVHISFSKS
ncbi:MAG TPA: hypothetical protein VKB67_07855 [Rhizomicrobium sp.]|nr:hypothetical protein [Rhizomicrobium sp.]